MAYGLQLKALSVVFRDGPCKKSSCICPHKSHAGFFCLKVRSLQRYMYGPLILTLLLLLRRNSRSLMVSLALQKE